MLQISYTTTNTSEELIKKKQKEVNTFKGRRDVAHLTQTPHWPVLGFRHTLTTLVPWSGNSPDPDDEAIFVRSCLAPPWTAPQIPTQHLRLISHTITIYYYTGLGTRIQCTSISRFNQRLKRTKQGTRDMKFTPLDQTHVRN